MPYLCLIEPDEKSATQIGQIVEPLCKEKGYQFLKSANVAELDELIKTANKPDETIALIIVAIELKTAQIDLQIRALKEKYKSEVIIIAHEDSTVPGQLIASLPVENILYRPLDAAICFEHIRFAVNKEDFTKTTAVHSLADKCEIEKIRRFELVAFSDFGFVCKGHSKMDLGLAYKFYHPLLLNGIKQSAWARLVNQTDEELSFIFCLPENNVTNLLRKRIADSKNKAKSTPQISLIENVAVSKPEIFVALTHEEEKNKLIDYLHRKFPEAKVTDWKPNPKDPKVDAHLVICDQVWTKKNVEQFFVKKPLVITVAPVPANIKDLQSALDVEIARIQFPLDRNFIGKFIAAYFPGCNELDPAHSIWITSDQKILNSQLVEVTQLSEAGFVYNRPTLLERGSLQEVALSEDDETEIKPLLAKTHFASDKPNAEKQYTHQIVFFGTRDISLKKLRLWMRLRHIQTHQKG
jgi:hypothetical protein